MEMLISICDLWSIWKIQAFLAKKPKTKLTTKQKNLKL